MQPSFCNENSKTLNFKLHRLQVGIMTLNCRSSTCAYLIAVRTLKLSNRHSSWNDNFESIKPYFTLMQYITRMTYDKWQWCLWQVWHTSQVWHTWHVSHCTCIVSHRDTKKLKNAKKLLNMPIGKLNRCDTLWHDMTLWHLCDTESLPIH
jgi:hypothetical protein